MRKRPNKAVENPMANFPPHFDLPHLAAASAAQREVVNAAAFERTLGALVCFVRRGRRATAARVGLLLRSEIHDRTRGGKQHTSRMCA